MVIDDFSRNIPVNSFDYACYDCGFDSIYCRGHGSGDGLGDGTGSGSGDGSGYGSGYGSGDGSGDGR